MVVAANLAPCSDFPAGVTISRAPLPRAAPTIFAGKHSDDRIRELWQTLRTAEKLMLMADIEAIFVAPGRAHLQVCSRFGRALWN